MTGGPYLSVRERRERGWAGVFRVGWIRGWVSWVGLGPVRLVPFFFVPFVFFFCFEFSILFLVHFDSNLFSKIFIQ